MLFCLVRRTNCVDYACDTYYYPFIKNITKDDTDTVLDIAYPKGIPLRIAH